MSFESYIEKRWKNSRSRRSIGEEEGAGGPRRYRDINKRRATSCPAGGQRRGINHRRKDCILNGRARCLPRERSHTAMRIPFDILAILIPYTPFRELRSSIGRESRTSTKSLCDERTRQPPRVFPCASIKSRLHI